MPRLAPVTSATFPSRLMFRLLRRTGPARRPDRRRCPGCEWQRPWRSACSSQIGRASCRERVYISAEAVALKIEAERELVGIAVEGEAEELARAQAHDAADDQAA